MARRATVEIPTADEHRAVIRWYEEQLAEPAVVPWAGCRWEPVTVGPTWQIEGDHWLLPDATLGWDALGWCGTELQHGRGRPWRFTLEQARFLLWWYAVDERGEWLFRDFVFQRLKGHGKDPLGACLLYLEALGPCRVAGMENDRPIPVDCPNAWVQTAAVSLEQTKNTMRLMPGLITPGAKAFYRVQVGKEQVHALGDERFIQAVTSAPATLEGARSTFVLKNETHHWLENNDGHEMAAVIERNATKSEGGMARSGAITNAPEPGMDSVAERDWDAYALAAAGGSLTTGILYDSLEAHPEAPLGAVPEDGESDEEWAERSRAVIGEVIRSVRGDSSWLHVPSITKSILDTRNPASRSRRFWYNQRTAAEDAWVNPLAVDAALRPDDRRDEPMVMFFDGSKSDDATALAGCRLSDGHVLALDVWQKPKGPAGDGWIVDRQAVDDRVRAILDEGNVVAFFADPSHAKDSDETGWWDGIIDGWHRDYRAKIDKELWSVKTGERLHSIMWDMASPIRSDLFTQAAMRFAAELQDGDGPRFTIQDHPAMRMHLKQARRAPNRYGVSLAKEHRESVKKIDLAVTAVGARMLRRVVLNRPVKKPRSGGVW